LNKKRASVTNKPKKDCASYNVVNGKQKNYTGVPEIGTTEMIGNTGRTIGEDGRTMGKDGRKMGEPLEKMGGPLEPQGP